VAPPVTSSWEFMAKRMLVPIVITGFTELLELGVAWSDRPGPERVM
jgi:hypothetical protein